VHTDRSDALPVASSSVPLSLSKKQQKAFTVHSNLNSKEHVIAVISKVKRLEVKLV
jgi:hypothetical protein